MKKILVLLVLSISVISCTKKDDPQLESNSNASYEFKIGGDVISSNSSIPLGMVPDASGIARQVSVTEPDDVFVMLFTTIPINSGDVKPLGGDTQIGITGSRIANYSAIGQVFVDAGTMTRDANDKVSFIGTFLHNGIIFNASGFIKSDGMKNH